MQILLETGVFQRGCETQVENLCSSQFYILLKHNCPSPASQQKGQGIKPEHPLMFQGRNKLHSECNFCSKSGAWLVFLGYLPCSPRSQTSQSTASWVHSSAPFSVFPDSPLPRSLLCHQQSPSRNVSSRDLKQRMIQGQTEWLIQYLKNYYEIYFIFTHCISHSVFSFLLLSLFIPTLKQAK